MALRSPESLNPTTFPQPGAASSTGPSRFPGLLSADAPADLGAFEHDGDRSFARDLNLDQIVAAIAGGREEHDLMTEVLHAGLRDEDGGRYRHEVDRES